MANMSWTEAIKRQIVTPTQARKARLRQQAARYVVAGDDPQALLTARCRDLWPDEIHSEYVPIPGRRYTIDIAFPALALAIEVDGWAYHGKHKADFIRDRVKDRALVLDGWRILRFTAGEVLKQPMMVQEQIFHARQLCARLFRREE